MAPMFAMIVTMSCIGFADAGKINAKEPKLQAELLERVKTDQAARMALIGFMKKHGEGGVVDPKKLEPKSKTQHDSVIHAVGKADEENTKRLGEIIDKHGWPTHSLVGKDGAHAAWLLVQHADADAKFQRKCLDLMTKAPKEEVSQTDVAYLTDRVLLAEGKKQLYGTQFTNANGKWEPRTLEDPVNVDKRRKEAGLQPLAEYAKMMEDMYGKAGKASKTASEELRVIVRAFIQSRKPNPSAADTDAEAEKTVEAFLKKVKEKCPESELVPESERKKAAHPMAKELREMPTIKLLKDYGLATPPWAVPLMKQLANGSLPESRKKIFHEICYAQLMIELNR